MKPIITLFSVLLGLALLNTPADARGENRSRRGGDGGHRKVSSSANRSPATASKIQRPSAKPSPRPANRMDAKPMARPNVNPIQRPTQRPAVQRPTTRPDNKPDFNRPDNKPGLSKPDSKPDFNRPDNRPGLSKPDTKPNFNRPGNNDGPLANRPINNRPSTLPGMVTYPNRPGNNKPDRPNLGGGDRPNLGDRDRPNLGDRDGPDRINIGKGDNDRNRFNIDNSRDRNNIHIDKVNVGRRNVGLNRPSTLPARNRDWDNNRWGGNRGVWGNNNNINVNINNNFRHNNNYSYRPNYWGARPWWGAGNCHGWHHGHWNYGWNSHYYHNRWYYHDDDNFASGFMWGIAVWSLGNMIYDMGYHSYRNPYQAPPVRYDDSKSSISYTEPISVTAAANPPGDEAVTTLAETKSAEAVDRSRTAFKQGDYVSALKSADEAIGHTPGDVTLHEYRALVMFALGKYSDAAGVLNPVLASGPGWGWDTMIGFYNGSEPYNEQLRKLEAYVKGKPDGAEGHFLLGYHYMVCGHTEKSYEQFDKTAHLQPADSIARQLRDLTKSSLPDDGDTDTAPPARPAPVPSEKLVGTWVSDRGQDGKVTFTMSEKGDYTWSYMNGGKSTDLKGTYGLNDKGLLVLTSDDSQMVSEVTLKDDNQLKFVLVGAPEGDPGLEFKKS
jgi:tetratricopeptide (TPR) repeat protein